MYVLEVVQSRDRMSPPLMCIVHPIYIHCATQPVQMLMRSFNQVVNFLSHACFIMTTDEEDYWQIYEFFYGHKCICILLAVLKATSKLVNNRNYKVDGGLLLFHWHGGQDWRQVLHTYMYIMYQGANTNFGGMLFRKVSMLLSISVFLTRITYTAVMIISYIWCWKYLYIVIFWIRWLHVE